MYDFYDKIEVRSEQEDDFSIRLTVSLKFSTQAIVDKNVFINDKKYNDYIINAHKRMLINYISTIFYDELYKKLIDLLAVIKRGARLFTIKDFELIEKDFNQVLDYIKTLK